MKKIKIITLSLFLALGTFILSNKIIEKIEAANFVFGNGTTSNITYNEGVTYKMNSADSVGLLSEFNIYTNHNSQYEIATLVRASGATYVYRSYNCSATTNADNITISCSDVKRTGSTSSISYLNNFIIYTDYINFASSISSGTIVRSNAYPITYTQAKVNELEQNSYNNGYNTGYETGNNAGYNTGYEEGYQAALNEETQNIYNSGYNDGVVAGRNEVVNNPSNYNLYTQTQYNDYGVDRFNAGVTAGYEDGYQNGLDFGYDNGYEEGQENAAEQERRRVYIIVWEKLSSISEEMAMMMNQYKLNEGEIPTDDEIRNMLTTAVSTLTEERMLYALNTMVTLSNEKDIHVQVEDYDTYNVGNVQDLVNKLYDGWFDEGHETGFESGLIEGTHQGREQGYEEGYNEAYNKYGADDSLAELPSEILSGFGAFIWPILTYEVFGISIATILATLLFIGILYLVIKFLI